MRAGVSLAAKRKSGNNRGNLFPVGTESSIANLTAQHDAPRCSLPARAIIFLRCETTSRRTSTDELHGMSVLQIADADRKVGITMTDINCSLSKGFFT